jgi:hypothetical protein
MARIRTIKPEFWTSEQIVECSTSARLLFIGLWNFADDGGVHPASVHRLKMEVFPADDCTGTQMCDWLEELFNAGLIDQFEAQGKRWWWVTGWHHQRIDRPKPRHPPPPKNAESSMRARRELDEGSTSEGKGRETEGKGNEEERELAGASSGAHPSDEAPGTGLILPTRNGTWELPEDKRAQYDAVYGGQVDVAAELTKARLWLQQHPKRRKQGRVGTLKYLTGWLNRATENIKPEADGPTIDVEAGIEAVREEVAEQRAAQDVEPWQPISDQIGTVLHSQK